MAMNMDAVLRIVAKVVGTENLSKLQKNLGEIETGAKAAAKSFDAVASSKIWQASAVGAGAFVVAMGASVKAAIDFESSMADVRKVVSGLETPQALAEIKKEILDLSTQMPITAQGFAEIYAAAGQSGIARGELREFATMVGKVSTAFDMTAAQAGQSLAQMKVALGLTNKEVEALADQMNYLSDNTGSTAANLVEFISRAGAAGKIAGLSGQETVAFGAAMIQAGIQTEVAATSFNIMLKALSAGTNMTDRQTRALERLGYSYKPVVAAERDLTREAETQSRARLDAARDEADQRLAIARSETEKLAREIDRRYQRIKQQLEDQWEDERDARDRAMAQANRQADKALQRQHQREQQALDDRYDELLQREMARFEGRTDELVEAERDAVQRRFRDARRAEQQALDDQYEARREALDRQREDESKTQRRADRNRQQAQVEALEARQDAERRAASQQQDLIERVERRKIEAIEEAEQQKLEIVRQRQQAATAAQKAQAEAAADAWKLSFAERLQSDGAGFLTEVLGRIGSLPKGEQLSVLSGLFGDEARGLAPLLGNLEELQRVLTLANDKTRAAGSVTREFGVRAQTTANQLQLLANKQQALAIETGERALPAFSNMLGILDGVLSTVMGFTDRMPGATNALILFGAAASALVLAAPGIMATITLLKSAAVIIGGLNLAGLIAGWAPVIVGALGAIVKAIGAINLTMAAAFQLAFVPTLAWMSSALVPALLAFFSGPASWTVIAVAAVVAMAIAFREPIMGFLSWLAAALQSLLVQPWVNLWNNLLRNPVTAMWDYMKAVFITAITALYSIVWQLYVQPWINLWNNVLREPVTAAWEWIKAEVSTFLTVINNVLYDTFVQPWINLWDEVLRKPITAMWKWFRSELIAVGKGVQAEFVAVGEFFSLYVATPIHNAWDAVTSFIPKAMNKVGEIVKTIWVNIVNSIRGIFNGFLQGIANTINNVASRINQLINQFNRLPGPDISPLPMMSIPRFATGGFVTRPTIAQIAEAGEPEYVVPQSKAVMFANNIVAGRRGQQALERSSGSIAIGGRQSMDAPVRLPVSRSAPVMAQPPSTQGQVAPSIGTVVIAPRLTGPVTEIDGRRMVSYDDLENAMKATAEGILGKLRTPHARIALGTR
jgi:hypothetical protein